MTLLRSSHVSYENQNDSCLKTFAVCSGFFWTTGPSQQRRIKGSAPPPQKRLQAPLARRGACPTGRSIGGKGVGTRRGFGWKQHLAAPSSAGARHKGCRAAGAFWPWRAGGPRSRFVWNLPRRVPVEATPQLRSLAGADRGGGSSAASAAAKLPPVATPVWTPPQYKEGALAQTPVATRFGIDLSLSPTPCAASTLQTSTRLCAYLF